MADKYANKASIKNALIDTHIYRYLIEGPRLSINYGDLAAVEVILVFGLILHGPVQQLHGALTSW